MVWSKLQDRILSCHWDMKAYSNTDVVSNKNEQNNMETAGDHTIPPTFDNARKKRMLRCFALLAAACMKCQWDICYALLRELLVILLADRFDYYYLVRHFFPL